MQIDIEATTRQRSDEELVAMLESEADDYTADALDVARDELRRRGIKWTELDDGAPRTRRDEAVGERVVLIIGLVAFVSITLTRPTLGGLCMAILAASPLFAYALRMRARRQRG